MENNTTLFIVKSRLGIHGVYTRRIDADYSADVHNTSSLCDSYSFYDATATVVTNTISEVLKDKKYRKFLEKKLESLLKEKEDVITKAHSLKDYISEIQAELSK